MYANVHDEDRDDIKSLGQSFWERLGVFVDKWPEEIHKPFEVCRLTRHMWRKLRVSSLPVTSTVV